MSSPLSTFSTLIFYSWFVTVNLSKCNHQHIKVHYILLEKKLGKVEKIQDYIFSICVHIKDYELSCNPSCITLYLALTLLFSFHASINHKIKAVIKALCKKFLDSFFYKKTFLSVFFYKRAAFILFPSVCSWSHITHAYLTEKRGLILRQNYTTQIKLNEVALPELNS